MSTDYYAGFILASVLCLFGIIMALALFVSRIGENRTSDVVWAILACAFVIGSIAVSILTKIQP